MPKGYLHAEIVVTDPAEYEKYRAQVPATIAQYGGTYQVRGGDPEVLEGDSYPEVRHVILEFESRERLLEWYHSPEYAPLRAIRLRATTSNVVVLTGTEE